MLKIQLQNAHTVMTIARFKLIKYLAVFRKHIPGDSTHELHQTMDGIEEVFHVHYEHSPKFAYPLICFSALRIAKNQTKFAIQFASTR